MVGNVGLAVSAKAEEGGGSVKIDTGTKGSYLRAITCLTCHEVRDIKSNTPFVWPYAETRVSDLCL